MAECLGKQPAFLMQERPWSPQPVNKLPAAAFRDVENIGTSSQSNCDSELIRFPTLAIGKAFDQAAVWLFCAVSSQQWFQGFGVSSRAASESLQARSSQADCVSFCHGDESWSADDVSVALITSPWGNVRDGITCWQGPGRRRTTIGNMAETGLQQNGGQGLHPCWISRDACDQLSFPKVTLLIFPCLFLLQCRTLQVPLRT